MKDTIVVRIKGGLGNQLYGYAFYTWLKVKYHDKTVKTDMDSLKIHVPHDGITLDKVFPRIKLNQASGIELLKITRELPIIYRGPLKHRINAGRQKINQKFFKQSYAVYKSDDDAIGVNDVEKMIEDGKRYLDSYWQDAEYFDQIKNEILPEFKFDLNNREIFFENEIRCNNAVSVHVRRGDYVGSHFESDVGADYYRRAIEYINAKMPEAHFYFFSDDKEYIMQAFAWVKNKTIVSEYKGEDSYIDMYLMSLAPNSIIANSTFSVWAAYLNSNRNNNIVFPDIKYMERKKLKHWIGL